MPSLKDIRKRVATVKSTQQITKAMKMVAAAKLRRAQEAAENARPYASKLSELLEGLGGGLGEDAAHPFMAPGSSAPSHVVIFTSDRGLCGGFNANLIKMAETFLSSEQGEGSTVTLCGRRGRDYFGKRIGERIVTEHVNLQGGFDFALAREVASEASERFLSGENGSVFLVYARFQSAMSQVPVVVRLLPIVDEVGGQGGESSGGDATDYVYEPDSRVLLQSILSRFVQTKVYQAMLESTASEHGARMTAMDSATRNASDMIDRLTLAMNRARQATITTELMEIVGGAEALKG